MPFDYTPLRDALKRMHARMGHGTWAHIGRASGLSPAAISIIAHKEKMVDTISWDKLYAAFPDEIPAPPWHQSNTEPVNHDETQIPGLGHRLKKARESAGLSIKEAAQELNVKPIEIKSWENDKFNPPLPILVKICDLFDVNAHMLLTGKPANVGITDAIMAVMKSDPDRKWTLEEITTAVYDLIKKGSVKIQIP